MSTIKANTIQNSTGGAVTLTGLYPAKAWLNFNGTGTASIRNDENISSITDSGTGNFGVNFTNTFSNTTYAAPAAAGRSGTTGTINRTGLITPETTSTARLRHSVISSGGNTDPETSCSAYFGN